MTLLAARYYEKTRLVQTVSIEKPRRAFFLLLRDKLRYQETTPLLHEDNACLQLTCPADERYWRRNRKQPDASQETILNAWLCVTQ